jgi:hypothetical protein
MWMPVRLHTYQEDDMTARPDLNGLRVKSPGWKQYGIYLIDQGQRRGIPGYPVYQRLFRDDGGVILDMFINELDAGPNLDVNAFLAEELGDPKVYLVDGATKRWITSPEAMDRFYFDWKLIQKLPAGTLNGVVAGPDITA